MKPGKSLRSLGFLLSMSVSISINFFPDTMRIYFIWRYVIHCIVQYFHQWNVRRLRPGAYVPYRYDKAQISDGLWFAEGITSYFDLTLTLLASKSDRQTLLDDLGKDISHVLLNPGCKIQSLADSSREAWLRLYKQTPANSISQISYYRLGTIISFCLDVQLRQAGS